ncbi:hypothetical protein PCLA_16f0114 [Pseudomonas citronellolis]|nr:hypothetical protein PCLA_16f0114 [Pseudomonas citronellolis]
MKITGLRLEAFRRSELAREPVGARCQAVREQARSYEEKVFAGGCWCGGDTAALSLTLSLKGEGTVRSALMFRR